MFLVTRQMFGGYYNPLQPFRRGMMNAALKGAESSISKFKNIFASNTEELKDTNINAATQTSTGSNVAALSDSSSVAESDKKYPDLKPVLEHTPTIYMHFQRFLKHFQEQQRLIEDKKVKLIPWPDEAIPEMAFLPSDEIVLGKLIALKSPIPSAYSLPNIIDVLEEKLVKSESVNAIPKVDLLKPDDIIETKSDIIRTSPKKMALIARMIRRMKILPALDQLHFLKRRAGKPLGKALFQAAHLARERGWDLENTRIFTIETQRKSLRKSINCHGRGRFGIIKSRECRAVIRITKCRPFAQDLNLFPKVRRVIKVNRKGVKAAIKYSKY